MSSGTNNASAPSIHNPEFLTKKPWYLGGGADAQPTLEHQQQSGAQGKGDVSLQASEALLAQQRQALASEKFKAGQWVEALKRNKLPYRMCQILSVNKDQTIFDVKFEDGTVEKRLKLLPNSSSSSRPRIRRTKTGSRAGVVATSQSSYDSKRDAYHGYDADTHNAKVSAKFAEREALRRQFREQVQKEEAKKEPGGDGPVDGKASKDSKNDDNDDDSVFSADSDHNDEEEYVQRDEDDKVITTRLARQGGVGGAQMKVTARNLRIREDTAKYLRNLDLESAYYDPKSRSMRDNPNPHIASEDAQFAGENFTRISGDAVAMAQTQLFAWEAEKKGVSEIHPQANPSQAEMLQKQFKTKASDLKLQQKKAVLDKYGGAEYLDGQDGLAAAGNEGRQKSNGGRDDKLRFGVTTTKQEYSQDGRRVNGKEIKHEAIPSKYEEDIFINGHTTVWGSYFHKGAFQWGYADDHSLIKMSYCTGAEGRLANDEANEMKYGTGKVGSAALAQARGMLKASSSAIGAAAVDTGSSTGQKDGESGSKRKYQSMTMGGPDNVTEEEMEAYRLKKDRSTDPLARMGADEVLHYR